ncbi:glycosyltransferase [Phreatobacter aquaticus]|uniref:glycosyltransferase n=1 Tax=Phreatobacter aquaticus TaxID=2570229 RepID=UPI00208FCDFB|nr:glycosyltransferase [Phreatobacter aquaticus]
MQRNRKRPSPLLSVVISTLNDERRLVPTLASLVPGAADGLIAEAIIVDGGSTDDTDAVADIAGCRFLKGPADHGQRLAEGASVARAPWLLFMRPGVVLDEGWIREVRSFLEAVTRSGEQERRAAIFSIDIDGFGLKPRIRGLRARAAFRLGFGAHAAQGLLISAIAYQNRGGHRQGPQAERSLSRSIGSRSISVLRIRARLLSM